MQIYGVERRPAGVFNAQHNHPGDPEKQNVIPRFQHRSGVEVIEIRAWLRPAQRGMGPQPGTEPGIQHIGILADFRRTAGFTNLRVRQRHRKMPADAAVPHRNPMPPPQLPADAPVADIFQPVEIDAGKPLRHDADFRLGVFPAGHGPIRLPRNAAGVGMTPHIHEPLHTDQRLHHRGAPLAVAHRMPVRLHLCQHPQRIQFGHHPPPRLEPLHPGVLAGHFRHQPVLANDVGRIQPMPLPHLKVHRIMRRGDLQRPGAELRVDRRIAHHRNHPPHNRQRHIPPPNAVIPRIFGMHRHPGVAQHRLWPRRGHGNRPLGLILQRIADMVKLAVNILVVNLQIRQGGGAPDAAVDNPLVAVNQPLVIQADKSSADGAARPVVQREPMALPVGGNAQPPRLFVNDAAGFRHVFPNPPDESLPPDFVAAAGLVQKLPLHHPLRRNPRVIRPRQPQGRRPGHPPVADQRILQRLFQSVAQMQLPGNIRRRHNDGIRRPPLLGHRPKIPAIQPAAVNPPLHGARIISSRHQAGSHR